MLTETNKQKMATFNALNEGTDHRPLRYTIMSTYELAKSETQL